MNVIEHLILRLAFDHQVIDICFHVSSNLAFEGFIDESLVSGSCVLEAKRHLLVTKDPFVCVERGLLFIFFLHEDFMVTLVSIKKTLERVTGEGVNLEINFW